MLAGDGMDDNWWPWRRGDRDEGLPPPRRHGVTERVRFSAAAQAGSCTRTPHGWVGRWLVSGGSGGVSVGWSPCCCGVCVPPAGLRGVRVRVRARAQRPSEPATAADETLALGHGHRRRPTVNNNNNITLHVAYV